MSLDPQVSRLYLGNPVLHRRLCVPLLLLVLRGTCRLRGLRNGPICLPRRHPDRHRPRRLRRSDGASRHALPRGTAPLRHTGRQSRGSIQRRPAATAGVPPVGDVQRRGAGAFHHPRRCSLMVSYLSSFTQMPGYPVQSSLQMHTIGVPTFTVTVDSSHMLAPPQQMPAASPTSQISEPPLPASESRPPSISPAAAASLATPPQAVDEDRPLLSIAPEEQSDPSHLRPPAASATASSSSVFATGESAVMLRSAGM